MALLTHQDAALAVLSWWTWEPNPMFSVWWQDKTLILAGGCLTTVTYAIGSFKTTGFNVMVILYCQSGWILESPWKHSSECPDEFTERFN